MRLPADKLIAFIPDDAFCYLVPGAKLYPPSPMDFDGTASATGLWGYLNALLSAVLPHLSFTATFIFLFWLSTLLFAAG